MKYEEAVQQLEAIVRKIENDELGIDELAGQLQMAQQLIKICKEKLIKAEEEIQKIQSGDDLGA